VEGEDGMYYMNYTAWGEGGMDSMCVATSKDLIHWRKHGPAFAKFAPGAIRGSRSGVVLTRQVGEKLLPVKINGQYLMYYTHPCVLAVSDNLIDWKPLGKSVWGGQHESGAFALWRDDGILLMFNGQNLWNLPLPSGTWALGQALIDRKDLVTVRQTMGQPFLQPEFEWEKKGYCPVPATVANGLVYFKGEWLLYYGAADRHIGLATCRSETVYGNTNVLSAGPDSATIHWRPAAPGVFGDANPFFWKGEYHVFYLLPDGRSLAWEHIVSKDLVHWRELPRALDAGRKGEPDEWNAASGSIVEKDGTFHIFYVGFNSGHPNGRQQIMHATSKDLIKWTKHPEHTFVGDGVTYWSKPKSPPLQGDTDESFRDPYVWWNEQDQQWWMAMVARHAKTQKYVLGRCVSKDLIHWEQVEPFQNIRGDDCPDIFQSGGRWYCIRNISYYSSSESLLGPYQPDGFLRFDTEHLCVAKRMWDGCRQVGTGWVRDLAGNRDSGEFGWGGHQSIPREFFAGPEGLLCTRPVPEVTALFTRTVLDAVPDKQQSVLDVPADYMFQARFQVDPSATLVVGFRQQPNNPASGYRLTIRPGNQEIEIAGPRYVYSRRCPLDASKPIQVHAFLDGSILECFVNDAYAFTMRAYDFPEGKLSLEVSNGLKRVLELKVKTRPLIPAPALAPLPSGGHP
jgi:sucrose-6-phosphate hydrolase SacC (GH32 family)